MIRPLACALLLAAAGLNAADPLAAGFRSPPPSARPWVYWFWLDGNITREAIAADLAAMARVGIGGVLMLEVDQGTPAGPVRFGSPEWRQLFHFMLEEARRDGIAVNVNNDGGWCGSGGPQITPELSMQNLTMAETAAPGGRRFDAVLPQPATQLGFYRDVAVLAFPTPEGDAVESGAFAPRFSDSAGHPPAQLAKLAAGGAKTVASLPWPDAGHPVWVEAEFPRPFEARTVTLAVNGNFRFGLHGRLSVSADGRAFKDIAEFDGQPPAIVFNVPDVKARWFRASFTEYRHPRRGAVSVAGLQLSPRFRLDDLAERTDVIPSQFSLHSQVATPAAWPRISPTLAIPRDRIVDLTSRLQKDGRLVWDPPAGAWTILRIGHTSNGKENHPAPAGGLGLECDKLSREAAQAAFAGLVGRLAADSPDLTGQDRTLVATHIDSWEVGAQNWTPRMREEFRRRRGYDPLPYLPAMTGRAVDSPEVSARFLWDLRKTVSDLLLDNYAGEMRRLAHARGLRLTTEAYFGPPADEIAYGGQVDEPMAEFWSWNKFDQGYSCLSMTSAAHIYGHRIVGAESFTANDKERWQGYPGNLKELGDWAFCEGINRFVFHRYALQAWPNVAPGVSMGPWGLHYERTQTWWELSRPWHEYLARCQYLLQQGQFVADICCVEPEGASRFMPPASVRPAGSIERPGYNFDGCPADALALAQVRDGRIVFPGGTSYRVLLLPDEETMTPALLRRVAELSAAGATVLGNRRPVASPSLTGYPGCDAEVGRLAASLWDGGRVVAGRTPGAYLAAKGVPPDFAADDPALRFTHRELGGGVDVYFVANPRPEEISTLARFRIADRRPELWQPETGRITDSSDYGVAGPCVRVPLHLGPAESVFVVFRHPVGPHALVRKAPSPPRLVPLERPWTVSFDPARGGPAGRVMFARLADWSSRPEPAIRYYSGTADYTTTFPAPSAAQVELDLGQVAVIAQVKLNGRDLGILWKAPYRVDLGPALQPGENRLEVKITNLWINRLIGDEALPEDSQRAPTGSLLAWPEWLRQGRPSPAGRIAFTTWRLWKKDDAPVASGLIGPVTLRLR